MDFKSYLEKLRALPDKQKKIVLWTIVAILGIAMGYFWLQSAMRSLNKIGESVGQIKLPEIQIPNEENSQISNPNTEEIQNE